MNEAPRIRHRVSDGPGRAHVEGRPRISKGCVWRLLGVLHWGSRGDREVGEFGGMMGRRLVNYNFYFHDIHGPLVLEDQEKHSGDIRNMFCDV